MPRYEGRKLWRRSSWCMRIDIWRAAQLINIRVRFQPDQARAYARPDELVCVDLPLEEAGYELMVPSHHAARQEPIRPHPGASVRQTSRPRLQTRGSLGAADDIVSLNLRKCGGTGHGWGEAQTDR
jgi:hypothetical protein